MFDSFRCYGAVIKKFISAYFQLDYYRDDEYNGAKLSLDLIKTMDRAGLKIYAEGLDNLNILTKPCVIVANHMSSLETFVIPGIIGNRIKTCCVMKQELVDYPVFGKIVSAFNPIAVSRTNPKEDYITVANKSKEAVAEGKSVIIFPQGTRHANVSAEQFNTIGVKIARMHKLPIVPLALVTDAWGNGKIIRDFGKFDLSKKVLFAFGKPIEIEGNGNEAHKKSIEFIIGKIKEWGRTDLIISEKV